MKKFFCPLFLTAALVGTSHAADKLPVAAITTVLADFARNVGGDTVEVTAIVPAGTDPHAFEPSVGDIRKVSDARVVLASGLGFEDFLGDLAKAVGDQATFVVVGDSIDPLYAEEKDEHDHHEDGHDEDHHHEHGEADAEGRIPDPHWWHSIANAKIAVDVIRDAFIAADPEHTEAYTTNAATYQKQLDQLAKDTKLAIAELPRDRRILVTSHDALGYFARDYGFTIDPVQGFGTADQPSSKRVRHLIDDIRERSVPAIFVESTENPKVITEITRETGAIIGGEALRRRPRRDRCQHLRKDDPPQRQNHRSSPQEVVRERLGERRFLIAETQPHPAQQNYSHHRDRPPNSPTCARPRDVTRACLPHRPSHFEDHDQPRFRSRPAR